MVSRLIPLGLLILMVWSLLHGNSTLALFLLIFMIITFIYRAKASLERMQFEVLSILASGRWMTVPEIFTEISETRYQQLFILGKVKSPRDMAIHEPSLGALMALLQKMSEAGSLNERRRSLSSEEEAQGKHAHLEYSIGRRGRRIRDPAEAKEVLMGPWGERPAIA